MRDFLKHYSAYVDYIVYQQVFSIIYGLILGLLIAILGLIFLLPL